MNSIRLDIHEKRATITLNRPEVFNAFDDEQSYELQDALKQVSKNDAVRVVILTGAGKAFCSGQDLKAVSGSQKRDFMTSLNQRYNPIIRLMRAMPKPIIGRINGVAAGAGCSLALACDVTVAVETAKLIEVFVGIGLVLDSGSSYFLPRLVGSARAFELATMATRLSAGAARCLAAAARRLSVPAARPRLPRTSPLIRLARPGVRAAGARRRAANCATANWPSARA